MKYIHLTLFLFFVYSFLFPSTVTAIVETPQDNITVLSNKYGVDEELVRRIISCESSMYGGAINHNRDADGNILSTDFGLLQVNNYYHEADMKKKGLDIQNEYDSLEYGIYLLSTHGTAPWSASKHCWNSKYQQENKN